MKSYEFSRYYNPRIGRFVYRHKGTGLIVDNIFTPVRKVAAKAASAVFSKFAKPVAKKALQSGISHAGDKLGKKAAEKSGDLIMKKLGNLGSRRPQPKAPASEAPRSGPEGSRGATQSAPGESSAEILNRLISGTGRRPLASLPGLKRNKRI